MNKKERARVLLSKLELMYPNAETELKNWILGSHPDNTCAHQDSSEDDNTKKWQKIINNRIMNRIVNCRKPLRFIRPVVAIKSGR